MKDIHSTFLVDRLAEGWPATHTGLAHDLVQRWAAALCTEAEINEVGENRAEFRMDLSNIRLRTMQEIPCLIITGETNLTHELRRFWNDFNSTHHLPFVLTLSEKAHAAALKILNSGRCLILSPSQIKQILRADLGLVELKQILTQQLPRRTLIPYNLLVPAEGGMFFGRVNELSRLRDEDFTSFAIAGPGRVGKTSLMLHYKSQMLQQHHPRASRMIHTSLYSAEHMPDRIARFLAMEIANSQRSDRMTAGGLLNFLRYQNKRFGGPLELLIDEVDEDCEGEAFKFLGEAARAQLCRLVLCGKGVLLKLMLSSKSALDCRLDLIPLESLDEKSARALLMMPLRDLGFEISDPDRLAGEVMELTGRMPNLIQLVGIKLVDRAIIEKSDVISMEHLEALKKDFFIAQFFIKPLQELRDPEARLVGLSLLSEDKSDFSVAQVQAVARREGLNLDLARTNDICLELLINNLLIWDNGSYRVATGGLPFFARKKDFLKNSLEEARRVSITVSPAARTNSAVGNMR